MKDRKIKRKENEEEIIHGKRKDTGRFNDGWPRPHSLSPWQRFDPTRRDKAEANHKPDSSNTSLSCEGGAQVKTKLTTGRLSPTIITSQQSTTSAHFWKGGQGGGLSRRNKRKVRKERKGTDTSVCLTCAGLTGRQLDIWTTVRLRQNIMLAPTQWCAQVWDRHKNDLCSLSALSVNLHTVP